MCWSATASIWIALLGLLGVLHTQPQGVVDAFDLPGEKCVCWIGSGTRTDVQLNHKLPPA